MASGSPGDSHDEERSSLLDSPSPDNTPSASAMPPSGAVSTATVDLSLSLSPVRAAAGEAHYMEDSGGVQDTGRGDRSGSEDAASDTDLTAGGPGVAGAVGAAIRVSFAHMLVHVHVHVFSRGHAMGLCGYALGCE